MKLPIRIWTSKKRLRGYVGFSFFIFIFVAREAYDHDMIIRHETIHFKQQVEMLFIGMWIMYAFEMVRNYIKYKNFDKAYRNNVFEREAYANDEDEDYLKNRKFWAWNRYW